MAIVMLHLLRAWIQLPLVPNAKDAANIEGSTNWRNRNEPCYANGMRLLPGIFAVSLRSNDPNERDAGSFVDSCPRKN